jgi:hypothetical protein
VHIDAVISRVRNRQKGFARKCWRSKLSMHVYHFGRHHFRLNQETSLPFPRPALLWLAPGNIRRGPAPTVSCDLMENRSNTVVSPSPPVPTVSEEWICNDRLVDAE